MAIRQRRALQFSGFEMALVAVAFVLTVTAVFFLGLYVGKKNASYHASADDRVARIPVDDFSSYKRPAPIEKPAKKPPVEEPAAPAAAIAATPAGATPPLKAPPESAKQPAASAAAAPAPAQASAPAAAAAKGNEAQAAAAKGKQASDAEAQAAAAKADEKAKKAEERKKERDEEKAKEKAEAAESPHGYTVQILSTRKQADADALVAKLKAHGYAAYIKKIGEGEDGSWYRVRVGSYGAFGEAKGMADKCRRDMGLGQAFVSTE